MPDDRLINNVEQKFIESALKHNLRIDGRHCHEFRKLTIDFSGDWGCALVSLGETKVLAQIKCEIGEPKATRPNEGALYINCEMSEVAGIDSDVFDTQLLLLNRLLERTFKESHCVDLESLCVKSEDFVWALRVDVTILNHDGNLSDASSIAVLAALMHFRRPDVSVINDSQLRVFRADEKDYLPTVLQHFPITVTHCICNNGRNALVDPMLPEEAICESQIIYGFNSYKEMCTLNLGGATLTNVSVLRQCAQVAAKRAVYVVNLLKDLLEIDARKRNEREFIGLSTLLQQEASGDTAIRLRNYKKGNAKQIAKVKEEDSTNNTEIEEIYNVVPPVVEHQANMSTENIWLPNTNDDNEGLDESNGDSSDSDLSIH